MGLTFGQGLALTRIGFGLYFLSSGYDKLTKGWLSSSQQLLEVYITPSLQRSSAEPFYRPFLENVVVPNGALFAQLVTVGELLVGVALVLGLLTSLGTLGILCLNTNYMLMKGLSNNAGSNDRLFVLAGLVFFLASAGLVWGLDGRLRHLLGSNALTRWTAGAATPGTEVVAGEA
jgi:thiosulfate dehydrogenase (quinone) large subunit